MNKIEELVLRIYNVKTPRVALKDEFWKAGIVSNEKTVIIN